MPLQVAEVGGATADSSTVSELRPPRGPHGIGMPGPGSIKFEGDLPVDQNGFPQWRDAASFSGGASAVTADDQQAALAAAFDLGIANGMRKDGVEPTAQQQQQQQPCLAPPHQQLQQPPPHPMLADPSGPSNSASSSGGSGHGGGNHGGQQEQSSARPLGKKLWVAWARLGHRHAAARRLTHGTTAAACQAGTHGCGSNLLLMDPQ